MASFFLEKMQQGEPPWNRSVVAFFEVPRLLVDANRTKEGRVPFSAMGHQSILKSKFQIAADTKPFEAGEASILNDLESLAAKWIEAVEARIAGLRLAIHHHTYDKVGRQFVRHDKASFELRPPMQLFQRVGGDLVLSGPVFTYLRDEFLFHELKDFLDAEYLLPDDHGLVGWDHPLEIPEMPFVCVDNSSHLIYEIRSDLIVGKPNLAFWNNLVARLVAKALERMNLN